ncbi:MAG TPA: glycoside hydrolase family 3 C-terminal domain-containing protein, partial [Paludibacteraceae bacterium]|nr:glycoside hydrolase family 3 C-terminal domain-containing protein [Paludibacteraceae bacterium]
NDGVPSSGNEFILKQVLRKEWGFNGFVVSDWASIKEMINHGFAADEKEAAMKAVNAGVDMEMVSLTYITYLKELIKEGKVKEKTINDAVRNILRIKFRLGLFDHPYVDENQSSVIYAPSHLATAKQLAVESTILLKNAHNILPLTDEVKTIAVIGPMADAPYEQMGTWVFDGDKAYTKTPLNALKEEYGNKINIIYESALAYTRDKNTEGIAKAVKAAEQADVVLAFVGEESILSGEAHCLADLNLQGAQSQLIEALSSTGKPIITIVMAGRPLTIGKEAALSSAVLYSFHPGTMGGPAIVDLLFGKEVPSGKTPITFPKMVGQIPIYYAHTNTGRPPTGTETMLDQIPVEAGQTSLGNTSFYLDAGFEPLYPFGYGLSYTTFEYSNIKLSSYELKKNDILKISFDLKNTGKYAATEVAQLYIQDKVGSVTRPVKELKRFARVTLQPGEKRTVTFELPISELAFWNIDMKKVVEAGEFNLWVAGDSQSGEKISFKIVD